MRPATPVPAGDGTLEIVPTPGHAPDHLCFFDREAGDLYCGDLARRGGTIVIPARKGGDLRAYLASLQLHARDSRRGGCCRATARSSTIRSR